MLAGVFQEALITMRAVITAARATRTPQAMTIPRGNGKKPAGTIKLIAKSTLPRELNWKRRTNQLGEIK